MKNSHTWHAKIRYQVKFCLQFGPKGTNPKLVKIHENSLAGRSSHAMPGLYSRFSRKPRSRSTIIYDVCRRIIPKPA